MCRRRYNLLLFIQPKLDTKNSEVYTVFILIRDGSLTISVIFYCS